MEFHKKAHFIYRIQDFGYRLSKFADIDQPKLKSVIDKIFEQRLIN